MSTGLANRTSLIAGVVKDPSKYWYVERYVYGVLQDTLTVNLGSSIQFGSVSSGYSDDTFYGWSISDTSTTRTFNGTSSYSNTTTTVKNNLDSNNTIKIYAIYSYSAVVPKYVSSKTANYSSTQNETTTHSFALEGYDKVTISGRRVGVGGSYSQPQPTQTQSTTFPLFSSIETTASITLTKNGTLVSGNIPIDYFKENANMVLTLRGEAGSSGSSSMPDYRYWTITYAITVTWYTQSGTTTASGYRVTAHTI